MQLITEEGQINLAKRGVGYILTIFSCFLYLDALASGASLTGERPPLPWDSQFLEGCTVYMQSNQSRAQTATHLL